MLRGENIACGTTTTGTGTLTLAATPAAVGALDPYVWLTVWFTSGDRPVHIVPYKIIEFTDGTFSKPSNIEAGFGTITIGANLAATTLARTTVRTTQASGAYAAGSPTAITIGTAANVLVLLGPGALDTLQSCPYFETTLGDSLGNRALTTSLGSSPGPIVPASGTEYFTQFIWNTPMLVKRASTRVSSALTGGTTNAYFRLYEYATDGKAGRLLLDLGAFATAGTSLNTSGVNITTALHSTGVFLTPGEYVASLCPIYSGTSGSYRFVTDAANVFAARFGTSSFGPIVCATATGGVATAPDPANTTGWALVTTNAVAFTLSPS